jgi:carboxyl-terminal processing protease
LSRRGVIGALERRLLILCLTLVLGGAWMMFQAPPQIAAMQEQRTYDSEFYEFAELFSEIYSEIRARYVEEVPADKLFVGAINGMFSALDPHSSWLPPDDQESLERDTEGEYFGVGLHIQLDKNKILTVIAPIPGSPAAKAGLLPWDRIIDIEGTSTENMPLAEAVKRLTGPEGTTVKVKVAREGAGRLLEFALVRGKIKIDSVFTKILESNIGYMRVSKFQEDTADAARKALEEFNKQGVEGLIVDLRNDPGGLLDATVAMSDLFLPQRQIIVSLKGRTRGSDREYFAREGQLAKQPLVVLVNRGSASASEIFAGAMKDTKRGIILGPKDSHTYGKGSVQTISPLKYSLERDTNGDYRQSALRLTTAKYYTPSGVSIDGKGITPDIGVEISQANELLVSWHGLLGDPDMIEPGQKLPAIPGVQDLENETRPPAGGATPAVGDGATSASQSAAAGELRDVLLDEAVKYLKAFMIFDKKADAAS